MYLCVCQLHGRRTLVPLLHVGHVVLAGAVLGVLGVLGLGAVQSVLVAGQHRVEVRRRGDGGQVTGAT